MQRKCGRIDPAPRTSRYTDRSIRPGAGGPPHFRVAPANLETFTPARGSASDAGRASLPPYAVQPTPQGVWLGPGGPYGPCPSPAYFRARGRIAVKAGRRPCPGASNNPEAQERGSVQPASSHRRPKTRQTECKPKPPNRTTPPPPSSPPLSVGATGWSPSPVRNARRG